MSTSLLEWCAVAERRLDRLADMTGRTVAWLTLAMMLLTCLVVVLRYLLNTGSVGLQESVVYLHGIVFLLAIAYTLKQGAHVRVDIFYQRWSVRQRALIDLLGTLFFLIPVAVFIGWLSVEYALFSWRILEGSPEPGGLPGVYLLKTLIPLMALLLLLQGCAELLRALRLLLTSDEVAGA